MTRDDNARLAPAELEQLRRCYRDLKQLATSRVPSVRAAARAAVAQVYAALSGQGVVVEYYSQAWLDPAPPSSESK